MTRTPAMPIVAVLASLSLAVAAGGCGSSSSATGSTAAAPGKAAPSGTAGVNPNGPEVSPAGDIPDNQAYVAYRPPASGFSVKVPEGWARTAQGAATVFTDKLNRVRMEAAPGGPLSAQAAAATEVPKLARTVAGYRPGQVSTVKRTAGSAVRITYLATSPADPVTGKTHVDAVERYVFAHAGKRIVLTLEGPKGADNVDPWKIVTDSLRFTA